MVCAKEDVQNPENDDDIVELNHTYKAAKWAYREHIKVSFLPKLFEEELAQTKSQDVDRW